jgi:hypothetical protein
MITTQVEYNPLPVCKQSEGTRLFVQATEALICLYRFFEHTLIPASNGITPRDVNQMRNIQKPHAAELRFLTVQRRPVTPADSGDAESSLAWFDGRT